MSRNYLETIIRCPDCREHALRWLTAPERLTCSACGAEFPVFDNRPVLLRHDNQLFPPSAYSSYGGASPGPVSRERSRLVPSPSVNLAAARCLARFADALLARGEVAVLVIGCGSQQAFLAQLFAGHPHLRLSYCDVDVCTQPDCYCDAHELPFVDGVFDGVIITAVLEHVLSPERAVEEIERVLKIGGLCYSEIPFMQQVHEGPYDFTRYTLSGHRRLFSHFGEVEAGMVAGPGTALLWAIEYFVLSFVARQHARLFLKGAVRVCLFWIKYFDYLLRSAPQAMDAASCTYFLGEKRVGRTSDADIVRRYIGGQRLKHV